MDQEIRTILQRDGIIRTVEAEITPLTGGVSSEIYRVRDGDRVFAVKRALEKLKVADEWFSDPARNGSEVEYLRCVQALLPDAVPAVLFASEKDGYFVMEFLGEGFANWKSLLLGGTRNPAHARRAAEVLAAIHGRTWDDASVRARFETTPNFTQLRLDPYLLTTGRRHPDLAAFFEAECERIRSTRHCLVHGDYSPKNILLKGDRLVVLDCEVAWFGDPTFDVAFLLNHFFLKSLHCDKGRDEFFPMIETFAGTYRDRLGTDKFASIGPHLPRLLLMLMLARVDGKSPVEYLSEAEGKKDWLRRFTRARIARPPSDLAALLSEWKNELSDHEN
jgi:aminoglycoside phosphotransferase (APT) family kinase protein